MEAIWATIMEEAMESAMGTTERPVPGAKLRQHVERCALKHGMQFPPEEHKEEKFGAFLDHFSTTLLVQRRPVGDFLVVPADKPALLEASVDYPGSSDLQLRSDVFNAFTHIPVGQPPSELPYYERETDLFVWRPVDREPNPTFVRVSPSSMEMEIEVRRRFAQLSDHSEETRTVFEKKLDSPAALAAFAAEVRIRGLSPQWHKFRLNSVVPRIKQWCESEAVQWRDGWLVGNSGPEPTFSHRNRRESTLHLLLGALGDEELRRVSMPLDIVRKLLLR